MILEKSQVNYMKKDIPRVSIGLPVYNGGKYLGEAIDSILAQTYTDFELIISDNASSDHTPDICMAYANKDPRIRYFRNEINQGAAWNFNRVFELSVGEYFKWAAHDDLLDPEFLLKCVEVLDRDPSAVLCYSKVKKIDENRKLLENYDPPRNIDLPRPHQRFRELIRFSQCFEIFGLIRANLLRKTPVMGNYAHGDGVLLVRLGLLGRMHKISEYLFFSRKHMEQSMNLFGCHVNKMPDYHLYTTWFDPTKKGKIIFPYWKMLLEYCRTAVHAQITWYERINCYLSIMNWVRRCSKYLIEDLFIAAKNIIKKSSYASSKVVQSEKIRSDQL
jgi:glycosyltransferase involved in cell wall biosynthesis